MDELARALKGRVLSPAPEMYSRDYGNIVRVTPRAVARPEGPEDVQALVAFARARGSRVVARGHACSGYGQALSDQIVLDSGALTSFSVAEEGVVAVGGGTRWGALQERLITMGLSSRVLTDGSEHTVGGTLSVGGYGQRSTLLGGQIDQVVALDIVTGAGDRVRATPDGPHADLFGFTLAGLGQLGVIVGADLRVEPLRAYSILSARSFPSDARLGEVTRSILSADPPWENCFIGYTAEARSFEVVVGHDAARLPEHVDPGAMIVEHNYRQRYKLTSAFIRQRAHEQIAAGLLEREGDARYLIGDLNVPTPRAEAFFEEVRSIFDEPRFCPGLFGTVYQRAREASRLPLAPIPQVDVVSSVSAPCVLPASKVSDYRARYERAIDACHRAGGRVYLYGYHPRERAFFERQLGGATMDAWMAAKARYDPAGIMGPSLFD